VRDVRGIAVRCFRRIRRRLERSERCNLGGIIRCIFLTSHLRNWHIHSLSFTGADPPSGAFPMVFEPRERRVRCECVTYGATTHEAGRPRSPPNVPIDSVIRVMQIKSIVRRHPRGGATSPARGVQPPSRSYDDVEPDTDVVLKVFKFNISPRCKRRRRESNPQARTHTKPRIVQSNSLHMNSRLHLRPHSGTTPRRHSRKLHGKINVKRPSYYSYSSGGGYGG
jgi:hypothetical protein